VNDRKRTKKEGKRGKARGLGPETVSQAVLTMRMIDVVLATGVQLQA